MAHAHEVFERRVQAAKATAAWSLRSLQQKGRVYRPRSDRMKDRNSPIKIRLAER